MDSICRSVLFYYDYFMLLNVAIVFLKRFCLFERERERERQTAREYAMGWQKEREKHNPLSMVHQKETHPRHWDFGLT